MATELKASNDWKPLRPRQVVIDGTKLTSVRDVKVHIVPREFPIVTLEIIGDIAIQDDGSIHIQTVEHILRLRRDEQCG